MAAKGLSTPNRTGRRFHRTTEVIPRRSWKSKSPLASRHTKTSKNTGTQEVRARGTTRHFLHSFVSIVRLPGRPVASVPERGHCERGLFTGGISRICKLSRIYRKWSESALFPHSGESLESLKSLDSLETCIFEKTPFSKRPLFQKTAFSSPEGEYGCRKVQEYPTQRS